ncbi:MAG: hypothetical protein AAF802_01250 [Planctomycetota bacterium]
MLKGSVHLTLMMGPVIAVPVPRAIIETLMSVEVTSSTSGRSGFQLTFGFSSKSPLNTLLLLMGRSGPTIRTIITVTVRGKPHVIMDGVITDQQLTPDVETGQSVLTLTGQDLSAVMDLQDFSGLPYPAMPPEARVALIVGKYATFGFVPLVIPSVFTEVPNPLRNIPGHRGTDLQYVKQLAEDVGYTFYVDHGPAPGMNKAYWGPQIKVGPPQPALNVNMDVHTNVESLSFQYDGVSRVLPVVFIQNEQTRVPVPIPIPNISPLNPPLGLISPPPSRVELMRDTAKLSPIQAALKGIAKASKSADAVTGTGTLDVIRYGRLIEARKLIGVRGAGQAFDGLYYVKSVTHQIRQGEYKQNFTLVRNGLISTVPKVPA